MIVLGIETSCDETGLAIYDTGPWEAGRPAHHGTLGAALHSQIEMHQNYGGVVPELASRDHIRRLIPLLNKALKDSGRTFQEVDAIAYAQGPGLAGALLVGSAFANALALATQKPLVGVHHLEGHLLSPLLADGSSRPPKFPFVALLVSGGHTQLMLVNRIGDYQLLGETVDDAAGEAFDKTAKLLGLDYPGGAALSKLAESGKAAGFDLPRPMLHSKDLDFSFSGLKTAVLHQVKKAQSTNSDTESFRANLACAFVEAVTDVLSHKAMAALEQMECRDLVVAGGVGANTQLRKKLTAMATACGYQVHYPPIELCTDNGVMIAFAGALRLLQSGSTTNGAFDIKPRWDLSSLDRSNH
ncbi:MULTISPECIES: tRNA (adenosine(37)-N6)-threonylcarbamoyltransferase complex transferase subunit TsaD [unclassified Polynucleobacter]|uniref:tRNA (adenosine(37)-N6)-threonylcarbamoyltransferase complex transferase subunit TsaD n=1 Tax=unclassified Polynucleobacter TaxID=2640945 RepID=UPI0025722E32|nr:MULTISPECIES: tRNA (adenosine(37)-N6)-threonylcarbamoyltransferase complex transferase subunit TsaD [unclassified Polynucleobacter]BEI42210.1 tRNA (adenosine(37)-N6)-threonylcarbamoyltransferase complex transferase subunit TsaD [Polynucleobacter sp. HIN10]BEI43963.1 tRNA (adenosine(37)-N6)-threonylcarbamoyltransferase complex transferase subunit TsaD [Polynucleobacter sp. HIN11]